MKSIFLLVTLSLLAACISVNQSAVDYYDFKSTDKSLQYHHIPITVKVPEHLKKQHILVKVSDVRYRYLNHAKWLDSIDKRIRHHLSARVSNFHQGTKIAVKVNTFDLTNESVRLAALVTTYQKGKRQHYHFDESREVSKSELEAQVEAASEMVEALAKKISESL